MTGHYDYHRAVGESAAHYIHNTHLPSPKKHIDTYTDCKVIKNGFHNKLNKIIFSLLHLILYTIEQGTQPQKHTGTYMYIDEVTKQFKCKKT